MIDFLRVAGFATLALGAAGGSSHIATANAVAPTVAVSLNIPISEPIETLPQAAEATPQDAVVPELTEPFEEPEVEARAESLAALVRRHASSETDDAEEECLAGAIYFESKGEPLIGQLAVARVILARAESGRFARTMCGVVRQPGQFSFVRGGGFPPIARAGNAWRTAVAIAHVARNDLWDGPTEGALFFHARRVAPAWKKVRLASVGNHVFYR